MSTLPVTLVPMEIKEVLEVKDPLTRAQMAMAAMEERRRDMFRLANIRGHALIELRQQGHSAIELAKMLGVTRQQVHRLLRDAVGEKYVPED